jgi:glyoxylase-like metal-dependent hydrolase (beta-lactamase superfamily II)
VVIGARITAVQKTFAALFEAADVTPDGSAFDRLVQDGDRLPLGALSIEVIHTPGHTPACVTYRIDDAAFVGDTLFMPDYGSARADFPGGDARTLYRSIRRILDLPADTRLFVGHDYLPDARTTFAWETTVADQRASNIHVRDGVSEDEFVTRREARDATLDAPALILPSLQVNIRAGALPPPSPAGKVFLKLPVNAL